MPDEPYEIVPYREIASLKKQIEELRLRSGDTDYRALMASVTALTKSMEGMLNLFKTAAEEMKLEQKSDSEISGKVGPLFEKVEMLAEQNKTIAEGMVALADLVKDLKEGKGMKEEMPERPEPSMFSDFEVPPSMPRAPPMPQAPRGRMPNMPPLPPRAPMPPGMMPDLGGPIRAPYAPPEPPEPFPDFNEPFPPLEEEPKKKGLFGIFKKKR